MTKKGYFLYHGIECQDRVFSPSISVNSFPSTHIISCQISHDNELAQLVGSIPSNFLYKLLGQIELPNEIYKTANKNHHGDNCKLITDGQSVYQMQNLIGLIRLFPFPYQTKECVKFPKINKNMIIHSFPCKQSDVICHVCALPPARR